MKKITENKVNQIVTVPCVEFRTAVNSDILLMNNRNATSYADGALKSLVLLMAETTGNVQPIEFITIKESGQLAIRNGNRRTSIFLHAEKFHFSENKVQSEFDSVNWNVKFLYAGDMTQVDYELSLITANFVKSATKAEKFESIIRLRRLAIPEADICRKTALSRGVVQPAIKAINLAQALANEYQRLGRADATTISDTILNDYKSGKLTVEKVNEAAIVSSNMGDIVEFYEKTQETKVKNRTWADIDKDIVPLLGVKYQDFVKVLKGVSAFNATDWQ
jgi:hypothetical protein